MADLERVKNTKDKHRYSLLCLPFVIGVGVGLKEKGSTIIEEPCLKIYVARKVKASLLSSGEVVPPFLDGIQTDVTEVAGEPKIGRPSPERAARRRPVPGGVSGAHYAFKGAATLTGWVRSKTTGEPFLLGCWHSMANMGLCKVGDPVIQPSWLDGGRDPHDTIARLANWTDMKMLGFDMVEAKECIRTLMSQGKQPSANHSDSAMARPISEDVIDARIFGLGKIGTPPGDANVREATLGEEIVGSGRSGLFRQVVTAVNVAMLVQYPVGVALFEDVDVTSKATQILKPPSTWFSD